MSQSSVGLVFVSKRHVAKKLDFHWTLVMDHPAPYNALVRDFARPH